MSVALPAAGPVDASVEPLLELRGIHAAYETIEVLHGVDLAVPPGSVLALLGANGAGKSTTLKVVAGLHPLTHGDLMMAGRRVNGASAEDLARAGLCLIPEGRGVFPNLTVREHLRMATYTGTSLSDIESEAYARFTPLAKRRSQAAGTLSGGEQQMLAMARAVATRPALLLLDELSMGLAPIVVEDLYTRVADIARSGISILVVEQFARTVLGVADVAAIMVQGRITTVGSPAEIAEQLTSAYLGGPT